MDRIKRYAREAKLSVEEYLANCNTCKICGHQSLSLANHIRTKHNMTTKEYREKFNCDKTEIISNYLSNRLSNAQKELQKKGHKTIFQTNNPGSNHKGSYSPFSRKFIKYQGLSEEEITEKIKSLLKTSAKHRAENHNQNNKIDYYIKRGCSLEEAKQKLQERQKTLSLNSCIKKYGEIDGYNIWNDRHNRWLNSIKNNQGYSKISQELFQSIHKHPKIKKLDGIYYAIFGPKLNNEYSFTFYNEDANSEPVTIFLDFYISSLNKCIEFDGDYWHSLEQVKQKDAVKDKFLSSMGIKILRIKEADYCKNPTKITRKCIRWLLSDDK